MPEKTRNNLARAAGILNLTVAADILLFTLALIVKSILSGLFFNIFIFLILIYFVYAMIIFLLIGCAFAAGGIGVLASRKNPTVFKGFLIFSAILDGIACLGLNFYIFCYIASFFSDGFYPSSLPILFFMLISSAVLHTALALTLCALATKPKTDN